LFGNPVIRARREGILHQPEAQTLLICGGSQGAKFINELMLKVIPLLTDQIPGLKVIHQTGVADFEKVRTEYEKLNVAVEVAPFFDSMDKVYQKASLLISRAGAGTLTEIALWGIPAIFIPFPQATDDHQRKNALHFVRKEAAMMLMQERTTPELLAQKIVELMTTPGVLKDMGEKTRLLGRPDAAQRVVSELLTLS
ncbi:MAG: undecaprenyldiphospho-muramoylpentapeptide beta-N-acetylglucosaminyltransferase, partial [uncultured bacterium]